MQIKVENIGQLPEAARQLLTLFPSRKTFAFYGQMGAGKTTFIKAICKELGVVENMSSPTFSIINEYQTSKEEKIYHFDFYRIKKESEAFDLGCEEYFYSGSYCFIEWPEKIESLLPEGLTKLRIEQSKGECIIREMNP